MASKGLHTPVQGRGNKFLSISEVIEVKPLCSLRCVVCLSALFCFARSSKGMLKNQECVFRRECLVLSGFVLRGTPRTRRPERDGERGGG